MLIAWNSFLLNLNYEQWFISLIYPLRLHQINNEHKLSLLISRHMSKYYTSKGIEIRGNFLKWGPTNELLFAKLENKFAFNSFAGIAVDLVETRMGRTVNPISVVAQKSVTQNRNRYKLVRATQS